MSDNETVYFSEGFGKVWRLDEEIPLPNRAMAFGDGLFETMIFDGEKIRYFDLHLDRLKKGMRILGLDLEGLYPEGILPLIPSSHPMRIKWTVFRAGAGKYIPQTSQIHQVLQITPLVTSPEISLRAVISQRVFLSYSMISACKTLNALPYVLAGLERSERGADEIILLDSQGNISEAGASNIFWSKGAKVFTPSLQAGCIEGISRKVILRHLLENGVEVEEGLFKVHDLLQAEKVWISNVTGIRYLKSIEKTDFEDEPFSLLKRLF